VTIKTLYSSFYAGNVVRLGINGLERMSMFCVPEYVYPTLTLACGVRPPSARAEHHVFGGHTPVVILKKGY